MDFDNSALGKRIKQERATRGWTQAILAEKTGISDSHLSAIECGKSNCSVKNFVKIANAFLIPSDALLSDTIVSHRIDIKIIDDLLKDCSSLEIKMLADCIASIKSTFRQAQCTCHLRR